MANLGCYCIERAEAVRLLLNKIPLFMRTALLTSGLVGAKEAYLDQVSWSTATVNYDNDDENEVVLLLRFMKDLSALHDTRELLPAAESYYAICKKGLLGVSLQLPLETRANEIHRSTIV